MSEFMVDPCIDMLSQSFLPKTRKRNRIQSKRGPNVVDTAWRSRGREGAPYLLNAPKLSSAPHASYENNVAASRSQKTMIHEHVVRAYAGRWARANVTLLDAGTVVRRCQPRENETSICLLCFAKLRKLRALRYKYGWARDWQYT